MLDNIDLKVIRELMSNARSSWSQLGSLLNMSPPAAAERVHKLEISGVIKGYSAIIDPNMVGLGLTALIFITIENPEGRAYFLQKTKTIPEILECYHITGDADYMVKIRCSNTNDLEKIISNELKSIAGIKTKTMVVLSTVKEVSSLPVNVNVV
ncbi:Lrp/AsnC family transcriptional regulator [Thermodesulfobium sp. 4217-1]|uniref:Lrp/AsnC family transcriptional regulator n=1 Tax=Thermodesulfobium sp. 4217-1 TaxID=3120013 RepID=UPI003221EB5D